MAREYEWHVEGLYSPEYGWEHLTTHDTREEALEEARLYDENEPGTPHRVRKAKS